MLDAGHAQTRHAAAVDRALPARELLKAQRIAFARLIDRQQTARDGSDDLRFPAHDPTGGAGGRQAVERQGLAKGVR